MKKILFNNDWITPFLRKYRFGMILAIILGTITMFCAGLLMFSGLRDFKISNQTRKHFDYLCACFDGTCLWYFTACGALY